MIPFPENDDDDDDDYDDDDDGDDADDVQFNMSLLIYSTHYHTLPHFDALKIYSCGKHFEKGRNCL